MRRATENQGSSWTLADRCAPRSKVKDHAPNQCSLPHFASFLQETPMKPSQVPNKLPHPPPRRMLPLQSPELCHRDKLGPQRHPHHHPGVRSGPLNIGPTANRPHPTPRDRQGPLHHSPQPPGSLCTWLVPVSTANCGTPANRPQPPGVFQLASPQYMKDLKVHSPSPHVRRDHVTGSKVTSPSSGSKNVTAQRQDANEAQSGVVRNSVHTVELHRPPVTSPLNARAAQEVCPLSHSERKSGSSLPTVHCPVTPYQDQHHKQNPSSEKLPAAVELNHSSLKRRREFGDCDYSAKKQCFQSENLGKAQTPKRTVGNSLCTSPVSQSCSGNSSVLEPKTTDKYLCAEPAHGQSSCASPSTYINTRPPMGAKQAYINSSHSDTVTLIELRSPLKSGEESLKKICEANEKKDKSSSLLSSEVPQKDTGSSPHFQVGNHNFGHTQCSAPVLPVKAPCRNNQVEESRKSDSNMPKPASKPNSSSQSCRSAERNKMARTRRAIAVPDDIGELFTPDPLTYVVSPAHKTPKHKTDVATIKSSTEKSSSSRTVSSSINAVAGSVCPKTQKCTVTASLAADTKGSSSSSACQNQEFSLPTVALQRIKLENLRPFRPKDSKLKNSPEVTSSGGLLKGEKQTSLLHNSVGTCTLEVDTPASVQTTSHCSQSLLLERRASEGGRKQVNEEDPIDVELNLDLSFALDLDLTQSSHSSDDEQLLSLQEIMERATKPPDTPEKGAFSEPSTPGNHSCHSKTQPLPPTTKTVSYKNNLDQMLKEINHNKRAKEIETQLLTECKEDLLRIAEYEQAEENREEGISSEHQEFLQRYSLMSSAIRDVPPGQVVFNLEKFGQLFNHDTLQLRRCMVTPQGTAQKTLLWSSAAHLRLHVNIGLFQEAYDSHSPCPAQVTCFLFKMMSVHSEKLVSEKILQALCDIACAAACQIVKNGRQDFQVWVPSLADVALVLMNMGAAFVTLFPFENLQPPFTEGDLLEDVYIKSESPSGNSEQSTFPEHNYNNILKYLSYCFALCPRAYTDNELLMLLTLVGRVGLDPRLILKSSLELYPLQYKIVNNFKDWDTMLPRICLALTDLTDDHHNMCLLVQLLPDNTRGKQLRRHLSLSMISKLVDGSCTYRATGKEIQLSELRLYLPRMQPSSLFRSMLSSRSQKDKEDKATLDQQSYYLCYSLLTLANEASNFQFFPAHQKEQLLILCSELETHVKCDIRESEKCLYRSKVKDLVARIYTKWQILLQRTRPLHGKLYDYWQPLPADTLTSSQEEDEMDTHAERLEMEEDGEADEENEVALISQDEEMEQGGDEMDDRNETGDDTKPEEKEGCDAMDDTTGTEEAAELTHGEIGWCLMDEQIEAGKVEHSEVETENQFEGESQHDLVAACDLVS